MFILSIFIIHFVIGIIYSAFCAAELHTQVGALNMPDKRTDREKLLDLAAYSILALIWEIVVLVRFGWWLQKKFG
jgi:hypothetical protein